MNLTGKQAAAIGLIALFGIAMVSYGVAYSFFPGVFHQFFAEKQAAHDTIDKTKNADFAIDNYEWFKQQKQDIDAKRRQIENTQSLITQLGCDEDKDRGWQEQQQCNRLFTDLIGQRQMYEQLVADYNSRSNQVHREQWKSDLPYDMEQKFWTGDLIP